MPQTPPAEQLRQAVLAARRVLLTGPVDPDGDSLGACLALGRGIRGIAGCEVDVAGVPAFRYAWMPGADRMVADGRVAGPYDLAVVLDGDCHRLTRPVEEAWRGAGRRAIIDHHASVEPAEYDVVLHDPRASSACEMVHELLVGWGVALDAPLAELLYTGLVYDTGGFRHSNTHPSSHRLAATLLETGIDHAGIAVRVLMERRPAGLRLLGHVLAHARYLASGRVQLGVVPLAVRDGCGATEADIEGIVDHLVFTTGVDIAVLVIEREQRRVKLSLRSRSDVNVALLARSLGPGGGGHPRAAGVAIEDTLENVLAALPAALDAALAPNGRAGPGAASRAAGP
jgi:phosphoesterase RecJ-like protein